jgi:hypothetical protein
MSIPVSIVSNSQSFGAWLSITNRMAELISGNVVTSDSTSGGSITTGNSFVNGHFGANYIFVANTLVGGNNSANSLLRIQANVIFVSGSSNLVSVTTNSSATGFRINTTETSVSGTTFAVNSAASVFSGNTFTVNVSNGVFISAPVFFGNSSFTVDLNLANVSLIANGSAGANGNILYSNGTGVYWAENIIPEITGNNGIIANSSGLFVNANNGLTVNSSGLFVRANTGVVANAGGLYVNTNFIATLTSNNAIFLNGQPSANVVNTSGTFTITGPRTHTANLIISSTATIIANGASGSNGQVLTSNGTSLYWANGGGSGATLTANNTDTQSFFFPMANTTSGTWSNGVVSNTKLFFIPSTGTLNATIFNSLSDRSSKVEIQILDNALDLVKLIDGVEFKWKDNHHKSAGVIAQEVEKVIPYLVETSESGIKSVNYNGLIGFLVESIKTLSNEIEELKISINRQ